MMVIGTAEVTTEEEIGFVATFQLETKMHGTSGGWLPARLHTQQHTSVKAINRIGTKKRDIKNSRS